MIYSLLSRIGIEVWKNIPEFNNYQVSNLGNVRSLNYRRKGKTNVLSKRINNRGRFAINIYKDGNQYANKLISVLVAKSFLNHKPCVSKLVVDHIDNNPLNDSLYNLQLITQRENSTKDRKSSSKYAGVSWHKASQKWRARININGKEKYLGLYRTQKEASIVYQKELKLLNE